MRRLILLGCLVAVAAACGDGGELRPYPAPPLSSPPEPQATSTTTTIDPRITARAQSVVLVAADMPGFGDAPPTTTTTVTSAASPASSTTSTAPARKSEDVDFGGCKAGAMQRVIESPGAVTGPTLKRGTGDDSAEVTSVAAFGSQSDATAALTEVGSAEVANCIATQLAGRPATAQITAPKVDGADEAKQIVMTVPRPTSTGATREVRFVFVFLRRGDGLAAAVYRAPTTLVRTADQTRMTTTLGSKLGKAASPPSSSTTSSSSSSSSSSATAASSSTTRP